MAGNRRGYRDYLSHTSSSPATPFRSSAAGHDDEDVGMFSQALSYPPAPPSLSTAPPNLSTARVGFEYLDLNSQGDGFPFLDSYSGILQSEGGHGEPQGQRRQKRASLRVHIIRAKQSFFINFIAV